MANKWMDRQKDGREDAWEAGAGLKLEKRRGPGLTRCPRKHSTRAQPLSFNGDTACNLAPVAGKLWALPRGPGEARFPGGSEAGAWGPPLRPACPWREDTQAPPATSHQKLWVLFVFKFLSLRKLLRTGNGELLPKGAEGLGLVSGRNDSNCR